MVILSTLTDRYDVNLIRKNYSPRLHFAGGVNFTLIL